METHEERVREDGNGNSYFECFNIVYHAVGKLKYMIAPTGSPCKIGMWIPLFELT
jgi:hypothetical protein